MVLPHTVQLRRLVMAMEQCFAFYNDWGDGLLDILRRGGDWYALLEAGHRALGNPMIIYNRSMRVLAYTVTEVEEHDAPFRFKGEGMSEPFWSAPVRVGGRPGAW